MGLCVPDSMGAVGVVFHFQRYFFASARCDSRIFRITSSSLFQSLRHSCSMTPRGWLRAPLGFAFCKTFLRSAYQMKMVINHQKRKNEALRSLCLRLSLRGGLRWTAVDTLFVPRTSFPLGLLTEATWALFLASNLGRSRYVPWLSTCHPQERSDPIIPACGPRSRLFGSSGLARRISHTGDDFCSSSQ